MVNEGGLNRPLILVKDGVKYTYEETGLGENQMEKMVGATRETVEMATAVNKETVRASQAAKLSSADSLKVAADIESESGKFATAVSKHRETLPQNLKVTEDASSKALLALKDGESTEKQSSVQLRIADGNMALATQAEEDSDTLDRLANSVVAKQALHDADLAEISEMLVSMQTDEATTQALAEVDTRQMDAVTKVIEGNSDRTAAVEKLAKELLHDVNSIHAKQQRVRQAVRVAEDDVRHPVDVFFGRDPAEEDREKLEEMKNRDLSLGELEANLREDAK
jgi:hypothetical protein